MRRELFIHLSFWFSFFVLISILKGYLNLSHWPFWLAGLIGTFLPDIDHVIYVLFMSPQELTSQRVNFLWNRREIKRLTELLYETRSERHGLIFHTIFFQVIFMIVTFLILSSSTSIFGKGLALSFLLHLSIDQLVDIVDMKSLNNWTKYLPFSFDYRKSQLYFLGGMLLVLAMGIFI